MTTRRAPAPRLVRDPARGVDDVRIEGLDRVAMGHSAETNLLTLAWSTRGEQHHRDVVLRAASARTRPARTVRPRAAIPDPPGARTDAGAVAEGVLVRGHGRGPRPPVLRDGAPRRHRLRAGRARGAVRRAATDRAMSRGVVEQIAAIHRVGPEQAGLGFLGDGRHFLDRQLEHWAGEMHRVQRGPLPALERLLTELIAQQPEQSRPSPSCTATRSPATSRSSTTRSAWSSTGSSRRSAIRSPTSVGPR